MSQMNCEHVLDVYPDVLNGKADGAAAESVRAHIASCEQCRAAAALLEALQGERVSAPAELRERVVRGLAQPRARRRFTRSDMAMAATLAAALIGGSVILQSRQNQTQQPAAAVQSQTQLGVGFVSVEDAILSGDASLDDLSVEQLEKLLGEIES